jgi:hypothetical protein
MAWSFVQRTATQSTSGTCTLPANTTAGNLVIVIGTSGSGTALTPPTGFSTVTSIANGTASETFIFASFNTAGGVSSFTVGGGSGPAIQCEAAEFTCTSVASVSAASSTGTQTGGKVATITVTSGAGALAGDLVIVGALEHSGTAATLTWTDPSGFDGEMAGSLDLSSVNNHGYGAYRLSAASGGAQSVVVTSSLTSTSTSGWTGCVATFSQPSAAVAGTLQPLPAAPQPGRRSPRRYSRAVIGAAGAVAAGIAAAAPAIGTPAHARMHLAGGRYAQLAITSSQASLAQSANPPVTGGTGITQRAPAQRRHRGSLQAAAIPAGNTTQSAVKAAGCAGPGCYGGAAVSYVLNLGTPHHPVQHRMGGRYRQLGLGSSQVQNTQAAQPGVTGGTGLNWRAPQQYSRAFIGNGTSPQGAGIAAPGPSGANQPGTLQPRAAVPVPRRYPGRAGFWEHIAGPVNQAGTVQPRATVPVSRRYPARAGLWAKITGFANQSGQTQPRAAVPVPRRYPARTGLWAKAAGLASQSGRVQPRATVPLPRRYPSRVVWAKTAGQVPAPGRTQPRATIPVPRRYPSRAGFWAKIAGQVRPSQGIQPRPTVPLPRRYPSRAGFWEKAAGAAAAAVTPGQPGAIQPRATVPVPRRYPPRAGLWAKTAGQAAQIPAGSVQPAATRQPRRTAARAVTAHSAPYLSVPAGAVQPRATVPLPRRYPPRAVTGHGPYYPGQAAGAVQPRASVPVPRRAAARAVTARGPYYAGQAAGGLQPRATVPVPRRAAARAVTAHVSGAAAPAVVRQPGSKPGGIVSRRAAARAVWHGGASSATAPSVVLFRTGPPVSRWITGAPQLKLRTPQ